MRKLLILMLALLFCVLSIAFISCEEEEEEENCEESSSEVSSSSTDDSSSDDSSSSEQESSSSESELSHAHTEETIKAVEPTCTTAGLTEGKKCSECGEILTEQEVINALGHLFENSYDCSRCDYMNAIPSEGLEYKPSDDDSYYIVSGIGNCADTNLVIPYTYKEKPVASIGDKAFFQCTSLTSITIPNSITTIGDNAFCYCNFLTIYCEAQSQSSDWSSNWNSSKCPVVWNCNNNEVANDGYIYTVIESIKYGIKDNSATVVKQQGKIEEATILESITYKETSYPVTTIGDNAFSDCYKLRSVTIGNSVTSIGSSAFAHCDSLTSITIPNSVTSIRDDAFYGCRALTNVTITDSVETIGSAAFYDCPSLTSVTIPNSVTSIGEWAFAHCTSLTSVTIPDSVTSIGERAFYNCTSLTSVTIGNSVTSIGGYAFYGCPSLTSLTIPDSVTSIGDEAFDHCTSLTIYCEATIKPSGWSSSWNSSNRPVVWGYTGE